jgi:hypothetical protein
VALLALGQIFKFARDTQDLYRLHETVKEMIKALDGRLRVVEDRLIRLETEQGQMVIEAKSAATGAATVIASAVISDAVTRVTWVEEGIRRLSARNGAVALPADGAPRRTMWRGAYRTAGFWTGTEKPFDVVVRIVISLRSRH